MAYVLVTDDGMGASTLLLAYNTSQTRLEYVLLCRYNCNGSTGKARMTCEKTIVTSYSSMVTP